MVAMTPGPLYHAAPNAWSSFFLRCGASVVIDTRFDAERLLATIEAEKVTHLLVVPTMFALLLKLPQEVRERHDLSSLRFVMHGAAPCSRSEEHTSELQSLMRISYAVFCLKKK